MQLPVFFKKSHDGGSKSGVTGYWLIEWKSVFSIVILKFSAGSREAYHSHAFNALTWFLSGSVTEKHIDGREIQWSPSFKPKFTPRDCFHKVVAEKDTFALSIRGPWVKEWKEFREKESKMVTLTHGRKEI